MSKFPHLWLGLRAVRWAYTMMVLDFALQFSGIRWIVSTVHSYEIVIA